MKKRFAVPIIAAFAVLTLLAGCSSSEDNDVPEELPRLDDGSVDRDAIREADDVSQCVKTTLGPCGCSEGGDEVAVNEKYVSLLEEEFSTDEATVCPQVYQCTDAEPVLENGRCTLPNGSSNSETPS